jgi:Fe-S cluster assembly protein SufB
VTKRAYAYGDATMEWVDGNLGSKLTMKYPAVHMMEPGARGEILSIAFSSAGQHQDAGAKLVHAAPNTTGQIISKSISKNGGRSSYRGWFVSRPGAHNSKNNVVCDALILDPKAAAIRIPTSKSPSKTSRSDTRRAFRGSVKSNCSICSAAG